MAIENEEQSVNVKTAKCIGPTSKDYDKQPDCKTITKLRQTIRLQNDNKSNTNNQPEKNRRYFEEVQ